MNVIHKGSIKEDFSFYTLWCIYVYYFYLHFLNEIFKDPFNEIFFFYKVTLLTYSWYIFFQHLNHNICFETNLAILVTDSWIEGRDIIVQIWSLPSAGCQRRRFVEKHFLFSICISFCCTIQLPLNDWQQPFVPILWVSHLIWPQLGSSVVCVRFGQPQPD